MSPEATKALNFQIVMLSGDEEFLRRKLMNEIIAQATAGDDFDMEGFEAGVEPPEVWFGSAGTAPFLSPRRVAVVRHLLRMDAVPPLPKNLPDTALVLLVADDELGDDQKQRKMGTAKKSWEKAVGGAGGLVIAPTADAKNLVQLIKNNAEAAGKKISPTAATAIVEMAGGSLSRSLEELEKLVLYTGKAEQIREEDVREVVMPSRDWNIFKLIDAIINNQAAEAIRHTRILIGGSTKVEDAAQRNILPQLSRQFRLLWQARQCLEAKVTLDRVPEKIASTFPEKPDLLKEKDFTQRKAMAAARNINFAQLTGCLRLLADADAKLKGLLSAYSAAETVETTLLRMVEIVHPSSVPRR